MDVSGCFDDEPGRRLDATVEMARTTDPGPSYPIEERVLLQKARVKNHLPAGLWNALHAPELGTYGGWNPLVVFLGLSPGSYTAAERELTFGMADAWKRRRPGGRFWVPAEMHALTQEACGRAFQVEPQTLNEATASAFLVVNTSAIATRLGHEPNIGATAGGAVLNLLHVVRPRTVVALKPGAAAWFESNVRPTLEITVPLIVMPVHPTALGIGIQRYDQARQPLIRALAAALARKAMPPTTTFLTDSERSERRPRSEPPTAGVQDGREPVAPFGEDPYNVGKHKPKAIPPLASALVGSKPAVYSISIDDKSGRRHHCIAARLRDGRLIEHGGNYLKDRHFRYVRAHAQRYGLPIDDRNSDFEGRFE